MEESNNSSNIDYAAKAQDLQGEWGEAYDRLTEWDNEPTAVQLRNDLQAASTHYNAHLERVDEWLDLLYVRGSARPKKRKNRSNHVPQLIRKHAQWRYAAISDPFLSTEELFDAYPVTAEDAEGAYQTKLLLNDQFNNKLDKVRFFNELSRTLVNKGSAVVRSGWKAQEVERDTYKAIFEPQPTQNPEYVQHIQQIIQEIQVDPDLAKQRYSTELVIAAYTSMNTEMPHYPKFVRYESSTSVLEVNHPTAYVCHHTDVVVDPACRGDITKARYVIERIETSLAELEADGEYQNLDLVVDTINEVSAAGEDIGMASRSLKNDVESGFMVEGTEVADLPRKRLYVMEYWGYWDINNTGKVVPIRACFVGNVMIRLEENPYPHKELPYEIIDYNPEVDSVFGTPDAELLKDNQSIAGAVKRGIIDTMARSAVGQRGVRKDMLDPINRQKFENGEDFEFNPSVDPRQGFQVQQFPEIPATAQYLMDLENADAEALSGIKAFSGGISGQALGSTATGIRSALDATSKRELDILTRVKAGVVSLAKKFMAMNAVFLSDSEVVRVTSSKFVPILKEELSRNVDIRLTISTAESDNQKAEELAFMLQTLGPNTDFAITKILLADIARLRKRPELAKKIEEFEPQPDPMEQQLKQLEAAKLQAEIAKLQAQAEEAKAKAAKANSESRMGSHKLLEASEGIDHRQKMQQMKAQAQGNQQLEVTKAALAAKSKEKPLEGN